MGTLLGLCLGLGLLLVTWAGVAPDWPAGSRPDTGGRRGRLDLLLAQAGMATVPPWALIATCVALGGLVTLSAFGVSRSWTVSLAFGTMALGAPITVLRARRRRRIDALGSAWPDVVDDLTSAVRAGLALPEALAQVGLRGPVELRPAFAAFAADYRAGGRFSDSMNALKDRLADPVGDRVVEALRVARDVGGNDLGGLLRTLSGFLREDARTRGELVARQAWTVNGARVAVAAPWVVLGMLALRPAAVAAYNTPAGAAVLAGGAGACLVAYRLMVRIGRLPSEPRVFG
jgi:tight adherence protein B